MPKLHQVLAIEKPTKTETYNKLTQVDRQFKNKELLSGFVKTFEPREDPIDGQPVDRLPSEKKKVVINAAQLLREVREALTKLFDLTVTKDVGNSKAKANIVVDEFTVATDVPVTTLLFLEKQLTDIHTLVSRLPVLSEDEDWRYDPNTDLQVTEPTETISNKKVMRNHVLAWPTKDHPNIVPQVQTYTEDILRGYWKTTKHSGALPAAQVREMVERVEKLQKAVLFAREQANSLSVENVEIGDSVLRYIFG